MLPRMQMLPFDADAPWLNTTKPLNTDQLKGRVIILHFWAYGHAPSQRSLEDLYLLAKMFKASPFLIIGVHTPKFDAERNVKNVELALLRSELTHPVVCDNDRKLWIGYGIRSRPSFVIIDAQGVVRGRTFGDTAFKSLHKATVQLLDEAKRNNATPAQLKLEPKTRRHTHKLYFPSKLALNNDKSILAISESGYNRVLLCKLEQNRANVRTVINHENDGSLRQPQGLAFHQETLLIADSANHQIKKYTLATKTLTSLHKPLGANLLQGYRQGNGQNDLVLPTDIVVHGEKLLIASSGNNQIWQYDFESKELNRYAGSGWEGLLDGRREGAQLAQPSALALDDATLYFCDSQSSAIREINLATGLVKTLVGEGLRDWGADDGQFAQASFQHPQHLCIAGSNLIVSDSYNDSLRILDLKSRTVRSLTLQTKDRDALLLHHPDGVIVLDQDTLLLANSYRHQILRINIAEDTVDELKLNFN